MTDPLANPEPLIRRVYAYVAYRIGAGPDADDVTSETFARALRYRSTFDAKRGDPLPWLIGIARRCIAALPEAEAELHESEITDWDDPSDILVVHADLAAVVAQLPARDRELVALRYGADLTARRIGELLDMNTNAVEVALHRIVNRLRSGLIGEPGADASTATCPSIEPI